MSPGTSKNEWDVGDDLEKWHRNCIQLEQYDPNLKIHVRFRVTAVMGLLTGKLKEKYDTAQNSKIADEVAFDMLIRDIKEDARKKELEHFHKH